MRFLIVFLLLAGGLYALVLAAGDSRRPMTEWTARCTAALLRLLGENVHAVGSTVTGPRYSIEVAFECLAVEPAAFFVAAVVAYPARWRRRVVGVFAGLAALMAVNFVRLISLFYVGANWPDRMEFAHMDVWQPALIVIVLFFWIAWSRWALPVRTETAEPTSP